MTCITCLEEAAMPELSLWVTLIIVFVLCVFTIGVDWGARRRQGVLLPLRRVTDDLVNLVYEYALPAHCDPDTWVFFRDGPQMSGPQGLERILPSEFIVGRRPPRVRFHVRQINFHGAFHTIYAGRRSD